jgi:hypothetical protein
VAIVIENVTPKKNMDEYGGKDGLIASVTIAESGLLITGWITVMVNLLKMPATALHTSYLHLSGNASAVLGGFELELMGTRNKTAEGPAAGLAFKNSKVLGKVQEIYTAHKTIISVVAGIIGVASLLGVGAGVGAYFGTGGWALGTLSEEELKELKEL